MAFLLVYEILVSRSVAVVVIAVIKPVLGAKKETGDREDASNDNQHLFYIHENHHLENKELKISSP